jgi:thiamine-monophosphate kinase
MHMRASEDELIAAIGKVLSGAGPGVVVGPGDDAAVLARPSGELVISADVLVEGVHFDLALTSARDLGYKAIAVNVSDLAAMAASPRAAVVTLVLPTSTEDAWVIELYGGMREACDEYALWLVGGDLSRGPAVSVSVTVTGEVAPGRAITRAGARPGDILVVTGRLGASAAGLRLALDGRAPSTALDRALLRAHFRPVARVGEGGALAAAGATAMMDISDGLALDLSRLCAASGVGARLTVSDVPLADGATLDDGLRGGEDYELLASLPDLGSVHAARAAIADTFGVPLTAIGEITPDGLTAVTDGREATLEAKGWDHFGGA